MSQFFASGGRVLQLQQCGAKDKFTKEEGKGREKQQPPYPLACGTMRQRESQC